MDPELIGFLREFGFPVFVVLWFMLRTETVLRRNTDAINNLAEVISRKR